MAKETSFEQEMKKLQKIVEKIESNEVSLDESISLYEDGLKLSKSLKKQLEAFEKKISEINDNDK